MGRTLLQVITKVSEILDPKHYMTGTTDSSGNAVGSVVDTGLQRFNNEQIVGKSFYFSGGTPSPDTVIVESFTQSTGKAVIRPDLAAAPNSEVFYLLPYRKSIIENAVADAIYFLHDSGDLIREILMYGYVAGSPIYNAGFDYWTSSTTPDGWSRNGSGTLGKATAGANTFNSRQSLTLSTTADYVKLDEPWKSWLEDFKGGTVRFYCPVKASNASHARIAVYDGTTIHYSSYHSGGGSREILDTGEIQISATATDLEIRLYNDSTNAVYFGDSWIEGSSVGVRELPVALDYASNISVVEALQSARPTDTLVGRYRHMGRGQTIYDVNMAEHADHELSTKYGILEFIGRGKPANGRRLKITASGQLSFPSTDTGIIEVTKTEELMLAQLAAALLLEGDAYSRGEAVAADLRATALDLRGKVGMLSNGIGKKRQAPTLARSM
jgi:hypothetical protein